MLFLLLGPSGIGKGTQINLLRDRHPEFVFPKSVTTRKMRPGESQGNPYHFISDKEFDQHIKDHNFLEYAVVHKAARYGTLKGHIKEALEEGKTIIKELDIQGLKNILQTIEDGEADFLVGTDHDHPLLQSIFILPPNEETLVKRITGRSAIKEEELQHRLESARKEIEQANICTHQIRTEESNTKEDVYKKVARVIL